MLETFGYISALLSIYMVVPYIKDIFQHKTKPERASWLIWTVLGIIAFASQLVKGATASLWLTVGQTSAVLVVFLLAIKYGVGGLNRRDVFSLIMAAFGLILWYFTSEPAYALLLVILIDSIGSLLTVIKSYQEPASETLSTYIISGVSGIFGLLSVGSVEGILLAYPAYIVAANFAIVSAMVLGRKLRASNYKV